MKILKYNNIIMVIVAVLLCIPSFLYAGVEKTIEEVYPLDKDGKVYLENVSGNVVVKSWGKNEVKILVRKTAKDEESLDRMSVDINQSDDNIRIITRYEKDFGFFKSYNGSVHYDLLIPDKAHLRVKCVSGSVEVTNIGGPLTIETVSGKIEVAGADGGAKCTSVSGSVYLEGIAGDAVAKSTSGRIRAEGIKGSVEANTVSGSVDISNVSKAEEIKAETVSGGIEMQGELSPGGIYEFKTLSGRIRLDLPSKSDFELEANTFSGSVQCDFELKVSGEIKRNKIQGVVGKGGASLKVSSFSGGISIK